MRYIGETSKEWHAKNDVLVDKWEREDAPAIARIEKQWEYESKWHPYFALFPVEIDDGVTAWLETVERRLDDTDKPTLMAEWHLRDYIYRPLSKTKP